MPEIASSPATFAVGPGDSGDDAQETVTFAIPAGTWVSGEWRMSGTATNQGFTSRDLVTTPASVSMPSRATGSFSHTAEATGDQLTEINAAAGGNLSVTYTSGAEFSNPTWITSISSFILYLSGTPAGGGGGGGNGTGGGGNGNGNGTEPGGEPEDGCLDLNPLVPIEFHEANAYNAQAWYVDGRYYISLALAGVGPTYCYDFQSPGWSDCGYGRVRSTAVSRLRNQPPVVYMVRPQRDALSTRFGLVAYSTPYETGFPGTDVDWPLELELGPYDGKGPDRVDVKRGTRYIVWGEYGTPNDLLQETQPIGTVTLISDTRYEETHPIIPYRLNGYEPFSPRQYPPGVLFFQRPKPGFVGRVLRVRVKFDVPCITVRDQILEYTRLFR